MPAKKGGHKSALQAKSSQATSQAATIHVNKKTKTGGGGQAVKGGVLRKTNTDAGVMTGDSLSLIPPLSSDSSSVSSVLCFDCHFTVSDLASLKLVRIDAKNTPLVVAESDCAPESPTS